jgi:hypothetical protein
MFHKRITLGRPNNGAANTERASPPRGKLLVLRAVAVAVLLATTILTAAPVSAEPTTTTPAPKLILISAASNGEIKLGSFRLKFRDEDILAYDPALQTWVKYFDGSDHDLESADLEDFEVFPNGDIIMTLDKKWDVDQPIRTPPCFTNEGDEADPEFEFDDSDVVLFNRATGCFEPYLKGSDVGLTKGDEDVDALACLDAACTILILSTIGSAKVHRDGGGDLEVRDEDLFICRAKGTAPPQPPPALHTCLPYFDGSTLDLTSGSEDLSAAWNNLAEGTLWFTTKGDFNAEADGLRALAGDKDDVSGCAPPSPAANCFLFEVFNGESAGFRKGIDGLWAVASTSDLPPGPVVALSAQVSAAGSQVADAGDAEDAIEALDYAEAMSEGDEDVDAYDFIDVTQQIYLPVVVR